ncbi:MAG: hypothetical protein J7647_18215 [Cyanobacteria bacterium SBLK]|nr:hypothetical protein [Cyanobacteria bacterium SBLK]
MVKKIKLMADYGCDPLWWDESDIVGDIAPEMLPLAAETIQRLHQWANRYDETLDWDDPANSPGFQNEEDARDFEEEGLNLWQQIQQELSPNYTVSYFSEKLGKVICDRTTLEVLQEKINV